MKLKEHSHTIVTVDETIIETIADEPVQNSVEVKFDSDSGKVVFTLQNNDRITLSPPKAKAFLLLQSWFSSTPPDERSDAISMIRMAYYCISQFERDKVVIEKPSFSDWFDGLEFEDVEVIGKSIAFFRSVLEKHTPKQTNILLSK